VVLVYILISPITMSADLIEGGTGKASKTIRKSKKWQSL